MSDRETSYLTVIQAYAPDLSIASIQLNSDGMVNDVVIVNNELVFRFPKTEAAHRLVQYEAQLLALIQPMLPLPIPLIEALTDQFALYRLIPGEPCYRHRLLGLAEEVQDRIADDLGTFLAALHAIPLSGLPRAPWEGKLTTTVCERYLAQFEAIQHTLYPYLWRDQKAWIEHVFAGVIDRSLDLDGFSPGFIHDDLASYHLLFDADRQCLSGVIDFGTAGRGDPAKDIGLLLNTYGERLVRRMQRSYPMGAELVERAKFFAATLEFEWALAGVKDNDPGMLLVHLGRARDMLPLGVRWV